MKTWYPAWLALFLLPATALAQARDDDRRTWRTDNKGADARLWFGSTNAEDISISFSCVKGRGVVQVFMSETDAKLKPGRSVPGTLVAGGATLKMQGRAEINEEAGSPSFEATLPLSESFFAAMSKASTLVIVTGPSSDKVSLRELGDKGSKFSQACRRR